MKYTEHIIYHSKDILVTLVEPEHFIYNTDLLATPVGDRKVHRTPTMPCTEPPYNLHGSSRITQVALYIIDFDYCQSTATLTEAPADSGGTRLMETDSIQTQLFILDYMYICKTKTNTCQLCLGTWKKLTKLHTALSKKTLNIAEFTEWIYWSLANLDITFMNYHSSWNSDLSSGMAKVYQSLFVMSRQTS